MWESVEIALPKEVAAVTTSVWSFPEIMLIGVMRHNFLRPPILWAQVIKGGVKNIRRAPALLTELQQLIAAPTVYAEAEISAPRNQALLLFLGFEEIQSEAFRKSYSRSI